MITNGIASQVAHFVNLVRLEFHVLGGVVVATEVLVALLAVVDVLRHVIHDGVMWRSIHVDFAGIR